MGRDRLNSLREDVGVLRDVLREYRETREQYPSYAYSPEDIEVLRHCGQDLRPLTYAVFPAIAAFYGSGLLLRRRRPTAAAPPGLFATGSRLALRLLGSTYALAVGFTVGSYRQANECMGALVALPTPLGGEICAILRARSPDHPLLAREPRDAYAGDLDGRRPRIRGGDRAGDGSSSGAQQPEAHRSAAAGPAAPPGAGAAQREGADEDVFGMLLAGEAPAQPAAPPSQAGAASRRQRRRQGRRAAAAGQRQRDSDALYF